MGGGWGGVKGHGEDGGGGREGERANVRVAGLEPGESGFSGEGDAGRFSFGGGGSTFKLTRAMGHLTCVNLLEPEVHRRVAAQHGFSSASTMPPV